MIAEFLNHQQYPFRGCPLSKNACGKWVGLGADHYWEGGQPKVSCWFLILPSCGHRSCNRETDMLVQHRDMMEYESVSMWQKSGSIFAMYKQHFPTLAALQWIRKWCTWQQGRSQSRWRFEDDTLKLFEKWRKRKPCYIPKNTNKNLINCEFRPALSLLVPFNHHTSWF